MVPTRRSIRHSHGIAGTFCQDCLFTWCCFCCVPAQESKELEQAGNPAEKSEGYVAQAGMAYAQPQ